MVVAASTPLTAVCDAVPCLFEKHYRHERGLHPELRIPSTFFINNCFYDDDRAANPTALSEPVLTWAREHPHAREGGRQLGRSTMDTPLRALNIHLNYPYLFRHCDGACSHRVYFLDVSLETTAFADPAGDEPRPLMRTVANQHFSCRSCDVCTIFFVRRLAADPPPPPPVGLTPESPGQEAGA